MLARFGPAGAELHDLARPERPVERLRAEAELEPPVEELEPLRFVLRSLSGALCEQLAARGAGAAHACLVLELEGSSRAAPAPIRIDQPLPEPAAAADLLERLLLARLTAQPPTAPVSRLALELSATAPAAGRQLGLFAPQLARAGQLDWQLAALAIRFGADRLLRARLRDPEAVLADQRSELVPASDE